LNTETAKPPDGPAPIADRFDERRRNYRWGEHNPEPPLQSFAASSAGDRKPSKYFVVSEGYRYRAGIDLRKLIKLDDRIHPKTASLLVRAILSFTEEGIGGDDGWGDSPDQAIEFLTWQMELILQELYPEFYALKEEGRRRQAILDEEYKAKQKKPIPRAIRVAVFERDNFRCLKCGNQKKLCADHVIPESKGGPTTLENLQTLCKPCNGSKGSNTVDYRPSREGVVDGNS
jgi:hypothetical protein